MLKYDISKGKVHIDAKHISLKVFEDVAKAFPKNTVKAYTYIHLTSQIDATAPYFTASFDEVQELVYDQVFSGVDKAKLNLKLLDKATAEYKKAYETPEIRIVNIYNRKVDQIRKLIDDTDPDIRAYTTNSGTDGFTSNLPIITKAMVELDNLLTVKEKLEAKIRKSVSAGKLGAGKTLSILEKQELHGKG